MLVFAISWAIACMFGPVGLFLWILSVMAVISLTLKRSLTHER